MDDYALVLNAGSSSLKFCVYRRPDAGAWALEARGQIEGIGTAPRFTAKDGAGAVARRRDARPASVQRRPRGARRAGRLAARPLRRRARARRRPPRRARRRDVRGPGRRHAGGARRPARARPARAAPPAVQPRGDRRGGRAAARRAAGGLLRHELPSRRSRRSPSSCRCRARSAQAACSATASTACRTSTSPRCCRRWRRRSPTGRVIVAHLGSGASLCALKHGKSVDSTLGFTALDGLCMGTRPGAVDPGVILHLFQTLGLSAKEVETMLYKKSGLLGISGISNDMRDLLGSREPGGAAGGGLLRLPGGQGDRRARRGARRRRRARLHRRHRRELRRDPPPDLRGLRVARHRARRRGATRAHGPRISTRRQPRLGLGDPDQRGTDDRPAHRARCWDLPAARLSAPHRGV